MGMRCEAIKHQHSLIQCTIINLTFQAFTWAGSTDLRNSSWLITMRSEFGKSNLQPGASEIPAVSVTVKSIRLLDEFS